MAAAPVARGHWRLYLINDMIAASAPGAGADALIGRQRRLRQTLCCRPDSHVGRVRRKYINQLCTYVRVVQERE